MADLEPASERGSEEQQPISAPILPLGKQREKGPVLLTEEARRIRWLLNGPLETAVTIMRHHTIEPDDTDFEPYYRPGQGAGSSGWHPFSQLPYTDPKVSSLTLAVNPLDEWRTYWLTNHEEHVIQATTTDPKRALSRSPCQLPMVRRLTRRELACIYKCVAEPSARPIKALASWLRLGRGTS
jgi:hypothetical protein